MCARSHTPEYAPQVKYFSNAFHRMASPEYFFAGARLWVFWLYVLGILGLLVGSTIGLFFVPPERFQGDSFRIMFLHVPSAHLAQMIYLALAIAGVVYLIWRIKMADVFIAAAAPVGAIMTFLALVSGMVWGKPTWGVWWVWDARLTSVLVLFFLYFGLIALRRAIGRPERAAFAVSVLAIIGAINIPIIKYSVEWFNTLHQPESLRLGEESAIATIFLVPLLVNMASLGVFVAGTILASMRVQVLRRNRATSWAINWLRNNKV